LLLSSVVAVKQVELFTNGPRFTQIALDGPSAAHPDPMIAQNLLCKTGYLPFLVKFALELFGAGEVRSSAKAQLVDRFTIKNHN
jgi:hypothetical protein